VGGIQHIRINQDKIRIKELIGKRNATKIDVKFASLIDHMLYAGRTRTKTNYYHVEYIDELGVERSCVVKRPLFGNLEVVKENIPRVKKTSKNKT